MNLDKTRRETLAKPFPNGGRCVYFVYHFWSLPDIMCMRRIGHGIKFKRSKNGYHRKPTQLVLLY